jgi:hypothetical protein
MGVLTFSVVLVAAGLALGIFVTRAIWPRSTSTTGLRSANSASEAKFDRVVCALVARYISPLLPRALQMPPSTLLQSWSLLLSCLLRAALVFSCCGIQARKAGTYGTCTIQTLQCAYPGHGLNRTNAQDCFGRDLIAALVSQTALGRVHPVALCQSSWLRRTPLCRRTCPVCRTYGVLSLSLYRF